MKRCFACGLDKPDCEFNKKTGGKLQSQCRPCQKAYYKNYYRTNQKERDRLATKVKADRSLARQLVIEAKSVPCKDCGIEYPHYVMDLDHLPQYEKKFDLGVAKRKSLKQVREELAKCEAVCSNCHRIRTFERRMTPVA